MSIRKKKYNTIKKNKKTNYKKSNLSKKKYVQNTKNNIRNFEEEQIEEVIINRGKIDPIIIISMIILITLGIIMVFSASYYYAYTNFDGDITKFFRGQLIFAIIGFLVLPFFTKVDWRVFRRFSFIFYLVCLFLSTIVLIPGIGIELNGARRWIQILGVSFQPSELTKVGLVLYLSSYLERNRKMLNNIAGFARVSIIIVIPVFLVGLENTSTAIVIAAIGYSIVFIASPKIRYFVILGILGAVGLAGVFLFGAEFRMARIIAWLDPFADASDTGFQTVQSLYAIASGGFFGLGIGQGRQKLGFIPEGYNDIIFAIICEELGAFGAFLFVLLFAMIIWRGYTVAIKAPKIFMTYATTGIISMIAIQVIINIAVVTNTIPNTGIPLPFVSYGGTSLLILMCSTGIVLNFSRYFTND